jgi:tetratricopeptide (TPR) repeat protein
MLRSVILLIFAALLGVPGTSAQDQKSNSKPPASDPVPRSDSGQTQTKEQHPADQPYTDEDGLIHRPNPGSSSSKSEPVDLSPPADDDKTHPNSDQAVREAEDAAGLLQDDELGGIQEFHPWDPHKAQKDIEVGDFYFKQQNYRAALSRYEEALYYKQNDAVATYRLAVCQEKTGDSEDARKSYEAYLKILPEGPFAADAKKALSRIGPSTDDSRAAGPESKKNRSSAKLPAPSTSQ